MYIEWVDRLYICMQVDYIYCIFDECWLFLIDDIGDSVKTDGAQIVATVQAAHLNNADIQALIEVLLSKQGGSEDSSDKWKTVRYLIIYPQSHVLIYVWMMHFLNYRLYKSSIYWWSLLLYYYILISGLKIDCEGIC